MHVCLYVLPQYRCNTTPWGVCSWPCIYVFRSLTVHSVALLLYALSAMIRKMSFFSKTFSTSRKFIAWKPPTLTSNTAIVYYKEEWIQLLEHQVYPLMSQNPPAAVGFFRILDSKPYVRFCGDIQFWHNTQNRVYVKEGVISFFLTSAKPSLWK